jgi:hypothetical protein
MKALEVREFGIDSLVFADHLPLIVDTTAAPLDGAALARAASRRRK